MPIGDQREKPIPLSISYSINNPIYLLSTNTTQNIIIVYFFTEEDANRQSKRELFQQSISNAINNPYISSLRDSNQEYNNCLYRSKRDVKERTKIPDLISSPIRRFMGHIPIPHKRMMRDHIAYHTCNIARHIPRP